jgi:hypothetical protein
MGLVGRRGEPGPAQDAPTDSASRCTESVMCRSSSQVAVAASPCRGEDGTDAVLRAAEVRGLAGLRLGGSLEG